MIGRLLCWAGLHQWRIEARRGYLAQRWVCVRRGCGAFTRPE